jgi:hypothetical protein
MALDKEDLSSLVLQAQGASMPSFIPKPRALSDGMSVWTWW